MPLKICPHHPFPLPGHLSGCVAAVPTGSSIARLPVSNLNFVVKLLEKNITKRIYSHLESNHFFNRHQSAYMPMQSTKSALLKRQNDLLRNLDDGKTIDLFHKTGRNWLKLAIKRHTLGVVDWLGDVSQSNEYYKSNIVLWEDPPLKNNCLGYVRPLGSFWHTGPHYRHRPVGELVSHLLKCPAVVCLISDGLTGNVTESNNVRVNLSKQTMVFPRALSLGRSFSHSMYTTPKMSLSLLQDCLLDGGDWMRSSKLKVIQIKQRFYCSEQNDIEFFLWKISPQKY